MPKNNMLLNQAWKDLLKSKKVVAQSSSPFDDDSILNVSFKDEYGNILYEPNLYHNPDYNDMQCCGITELNFLQLVRAYENAGNFFTEIIAKFLGNLVYHFGDQRILIVGMPTKTGFSTMYNISYYRKLRKVLLSFGFVELVDKPYRNYNSGNKVTVLVCQIPKMKKLDFDYIKKETDK